MAGSVGIPPAALRAAIAVVVLGLAAFPAASQPAVTVNGDCNVTPVAVGSGKINIDLRGYNCYARDKPKNVLRVMYYWLDPITSSFLIGRRIDPSLRKLLGEAPITLPTAALADAKDLVDRFGSRVDANPTLLGGTLSISVQSEQKSAKLKNAAADKIPRSFTKGLKIYDALDEISIPDVDAYQALLSPDRWPGGYAAFFCPKATESSWTESSIANALFLWRFAKREDLETFSDKVHAIMTMARSKRIARPLAENLRYGGFISEQDKEKDASKEPVSVAPTTKIVNKEVEAMLYVTRESWPDDFLLILGSNKEGCGAFPSFAASPREFFLQIAVLENTSTTTPIPLSAVRVQEAGGSGLRAPEADTAWREASLPFPPGILRPGEKLVIPMRIDFRLPRYDRQVLGERYVPARSRATDDFMRRKFARIELGADLDRKERVWKKVAVFPSPAAPEIRPSYVYGRRLSLVSVVSEDAEIPVRPYNPASIFTVAEFETGSCPFLYASYSDSPEPLKIGRLFRLASSADRAAKFERTFDKSLRELVIAEEEPEITHVQRLRLVARDKRGAVLDEISIDDVRLSFGEQLVVRPRVNDRVETYTLVAEGYYQPLGAIVGINTTR